MEHFTADQIAIACADASLTDAQCESLLIALHYTPAAEPAIQQEGVRKYTQEDMERFAKNCMAARDERLSGELQEGAALDERQSLYNVALTDEEIVKALHSLAIDTFPSAYGFAEIQVSGTNVPGIRRIVARCNRIIAEKEGSGRAAPLPVQPARGEALSQQAEDSRLLDWLEANCATLTRLHDDSGYILSVNGLARSTGKTARAALSEQAPAPVWAAPVALFEGYVDGMPRIKWTAGGLPVGTELYAQVDTSFQQGRAAGIEEAAKLADEIDGPISMRRLGESIRALNKQEPTA